MSHELSARGCGDDVIDQGEACDRGAANSDTEANGCRTTCALARCGDSVVDQGEQCDNGAARSNTLPGACRLDCRSARCGDGVRDGDEGCDDGNTIDTDMCRNSCRSARCGDMVRDPEEECDDGNTTSGDGCQSTCRSPVCGDRAVDSGEQCDDGNGVDNDGCRSTCQRGCTDAPSCTDGLYCNGVERCETNGVCAAGAAPALTDGVECTVDACDEAADRVTHTPMNARCEPEPPYCIEARATTATATCDASRGCLQRSTSTACGDTPSSCALRGDGSYTLTTYTSGCAGDNISCGTPSAATRSCASAPASCSVGRVFTGVAAATCDPGTETCGRSAPALDDCTTRDRSSCAADDTSFTQVRGTCSTAGGCGSTTSSTPCADPGDACAGGRLRTFAPTCDDAAGCQTARQTSDTGCTPRGPSCATNPDDGLASLTRYTAACASGTSCSPVGTPSAPERCPAASDSCGANAAGVASITRYAPACASGTSCSPTGSAQTPVPCAAGASTCGATGADGALAVQRYMPACDASVPGQCRAGGTPQPRELCGSRTQVCSPTAAGVPSIIRYAPACSGASCVPGGSELPPVACTARSETSCTFGPLQQPQETRYVPSCSPTDPASCVAGGSALTTNCTAPTGTTCGPTGTAGAPQVTSFYADCNAARTGCQVGGARTVRNCFAPGPVCRIEGNRAVRVTAVAACNAQNSDCLPSGSATTQVCSSIPVRCEGTVAVRTVDRCAGSECATTREQCTARSEELCTATGIESRRYTGQCVAGTGCAFSVAASEPCGMVCQQTSPGATTFQECPTSCTADELEGVLYCATDRTRCVTCPRGCSGNRCAAVLINPFPNVPPIITDPPVFNPGPF